MSEANEKSEEVFRRIVRLLEEAVRAGANSVGLEREGGDLTVVHYFGSTGQAEGSIPKALEQALVDEIIDRSGLAHSPRGEMQINLAGDDYKVIVDQRDDFGESAFNLLLKRSKRARKSSGDPGSSV